MVSLHIFRTTPQDWTLTLTQATVIVLGDNKRPARAHCISNEEWQIHSVQKLNH